MVDTIRRVIWGMAMVCVLICWRIASADDSAVRAKYANDNTELGTLKRGGDFYSNTASPIGDLPPQISGLMFTRRAHGKPSDVTLSAPAGSTVYLLVGSEKAAIATKKKVLELHHSLETAGWTRLADIQTDAPDQYWLALYEQKFSAAKTLVITGATPSGIAVAARNLALDASEGPEGKKSDGSPREASLHIDGPTADKPVAGPTTRVSNPQATIKALEILEMDSGLMLGQTSEATLTITPADSPRQVSVRFVTKVGDEMCIARDEAMRFIRVKYPNWNADAAEISFEDKYTAHDGGSIGTAIATMVLSAIQGFQIDPNIAVTGDISANGKVRAIGGVSAKIKGAIASDCRLVAIPMENQGQLVDAVTYSGPLMLSDIQVIGISNMDDAVATVRTDRDAKMAQAISLFFEIQTNIKNVPGYLKKPEGKEKLTQVLELCPRHLSARALLDVITGKQPKTLSGTATRYYTSLAVRNVLAVLDQRDKWKDPQLVPSAVVRIGLADLRKLMPLADPNVKPLIVAWMQFIEAWNDLQQGQGSSQQLEKRGQVLTDEMTKEDTNADLMQKTLKEGF